MDYMHIEDEYFDWMYDLVCGDRFSNGNSYRKLLSYLHDTRFRYSIRKDGGRAEDGVNLRRRFDKYHGDLIEGPCSVLEMMVALAIRCEETIMDNPEYGDRTAQWFWQMIVSLELGSMNDGRFELSYVKDVVTRFLRRDFEPDGRGGLFTIRDCEYDLRTVEIWFIMLWYLDSIGVV